MPALEDFREVLEEFLPPGVPWETRVRFVRSLGTALVPATMAVLPSKEGRRPLVTLGFYHPREGIALRRDELDTAAGMSLLTHEAYHSWQAEHYEGGPEAFVEDYRRLEEERIARGLEVWEHPLEYPAYVLECRVWHQLVDEGWAPGGWLPLGVLVELC